MKLFFIVALIFAFVNVVYLQQDENDRQWREHMEYMQRLNQQQQQQEQYQHQMGAFPPMGAAVFGR